MAPQELKSSNKKIFGIAAIVLTSAVLTVGGVVYYRNRGTNNEDQITATSGQTLKNVKGGDGKVGGSDLVLNQAATGAAAGNVGDKTGASSNTAAQITKTGEKQTAGANLKVSKNGADAVVDGKTPIAEGSGSDAASVVSVAVLKKEDTAVKNTVPKKKGAVVEKTPTGTDATKPKNTDATKPKSTEAAKPEGSEAAKPEGSEAAAKLEGTKSAKPEGTKAAKPDEKPTNPEATKPKGTETVKPDEKPAKPEGAKPEGTDTIGSDLSDGSSGNDASGSDANGPKAPKETCSGAPKDTSNANVDEKKPTEPKPEGDKSADGKNHSEPNPNEETDKGDEKKPTEPRPIEDEGEKPTAEPSSKGDKSDVTKPAEIPPTEQEKEKKPVVEKTAEEIKLEQEAAAEKAAEETKTANERYVAKQDSEMTESNKIYKKKVTRPNRSKPTAQAAKKHLTMQVGK